ncbi:MAG: hypothetical protein ACRD3G_17195 [Vicinamibacterales bacterium]
MRLSRILLLIGAFALPAVPAAAQGKAIGKPAGVGKPATGVVKGASGTVTKGKSADAKAGTLVKGQSADHAKGPKTTTTTDVETTDTSVDSADSKALGQKTLAERIDVMIQRDKGLASRITAAIGTLTVEQATEGFPNQGQFIKAINAVTHNPTITFAALQTEMNTNHVSVEQALKNLGVVDTTETTTTTTTTTTTP